MAFSDRGDYDLLFKQFGEVGGDKDDYSNAMALLSCGFPISPNKPGCEFLKQSAEVVGDESNDDDCVILDGDPDKTLVVVNRREYDDCDELKIVGEKGKIACRDFPHPRYLCANFPFASTPHELHCGQCHCYVCDSLAPCSHWDTNISSTDHCHASDKEEHWRAERILVKKGDMPVTVIPSMDDDAFLIQALLQTPEVPTLDLPQPKPLPQNQGSTPVTIYPSNVSVPNAVNQGGVHPPGFSTHISNPQSQLVSPQSYPTFNRNNIASRDRTRNPRSLSSQSFPHRAPYKRSGLVGASLHHRYGYGSRLSIDSSLRWCRAFKTPVINAGHGSNQLNIRHHVAPSVSPQPKFSSQLNYLPSQPQMQLDPYPSPLITDPIHCQSQMPYVNANFVHTKNFKNLILPEPRVVFHPSNVFGNDQLPSMSMMASRFDVGNEFESRFFQPQARNIPATILMDGQNDFEQGNHSWSGVCVSSEDCGSVWDSSLSHGNSQISSIGLPTPNGGTSCLFSTTKYNEKRSW